MLHLPFKNYEEFLNLFGMQEHGNGVKSRKNKILLAYYKSKEILRYATATEQPELLEITDIAQLKKVLLQKIKYQGFPYKYKLQLVNDLFRSNTYETDEMKGVCEDGDCRCVRYIKHEEDSAKPYKMKAGKFFKNIIEETYLGQILPEQVKIWLMEEFTLEFQTYAMGIMPQNKLFVNKEFARIYDASALLGDFGSCMVNRQLHTFYADAVDASAAYLQNEDGKIIARCIIFNKVYDFETGETFRLAERQYSSNGNEVYKHALVDALIKGGYIDGYKRVGAGCGDAKAFVDNVGNSLSERTLYIECSADGGDIYSYQDSFKWLSTFKGLAYNDCSMDYDYALDSTYGRIGNNEDDDDDEPQEWDSYHERDAYEITTVHVHGEMLTCDVEDMDDFVYIGTEWYHKDDVSCCPGCGKKFVTEEAGVYSDVTDKTYCCASCLDTAEDNYKRLHWHWSEYDQKYYEDENDIKKFHCWNAETNEYVETTIYDETYDELVRIGSLILFEGEAFDATNPDTRLPFGYNLIKTTKQLTIPEYGTFKEAV